jgi:hypothetical protein
MSSPQNTTLVLSDIELGLMVSTNLLFSAGGTVGNLCVCVAFLMYRNLRNTMNIFIFSLACSDLIVCLVAQPMFAVRLIQNVQDGGTTTISEDIRKRLTWISLLASIGNLIGVTLDRYFIISNPLRYAARVPTKSACVFIVIVWTIASVLGILTESYRSAKLIGQVYVLVLLVGMIIPLYCHILCIARRHARIIHTSLSHVQLNTLAECSRMSNVRKADRNSLKTLGIISTIFVVGWFPLLIIPFLYRAGVYHSTVMVHAFQWVNTLALCSSACNPIVYSWRDRRFRKALTVTYGRWRARRSISIGNDSGVCTISERLEMKTFVRA